MLKCLTVCWLYVERTDDWYRDDNIKGTQNYCHKSITLHSNNLWCVLAGLHSPVWAWPLCPPQLHLFLGEIKQLAAGWAFAFLSQPHITRQPGNSRQLYKCAFDFKFNIGPIENKLRWSGGIHLPKVFTGINIVLSLKTQKRLKSHIKFIELNIDFRR